MSLVATYHGRCTQCGEDIIPGQRIEHLDNGDGWAHVHCGARPETTTECACSRCFLVHAGECAW